MTYRMYISRLVEGRQLNDCDAGSWYADTVKAAAEGPSRSKDCPFAARPAVFEEHLRQRVRTFSSQEGPTLFVVIGWTLPSA